MKRIPYSDPCVNGSPVPPHLRGGCAGSSVEQGVNLSLNVANQRLSALRQQHQASKTTSRCGEGFAHLTRERQEISTGKAENSHTVDSWLAPLVGIENRAEPSPLALLPEGERDASDVRPSQAYHSQADRNPTPNSIQVSPELVAGMLREEAVGTGRVWLLARALDESGRGWISVEMLREQLTKKGSAWRICGWRRLRQILTAGSGLFWQRDSYGRVWLVGQAQVAANLGVERLSRKTVDLPSDTLFGGIGAVRAAFFAAQHTGGAPISRATLAQMTTVPERTQRHYDSVTGTQKEVNWGIGATASAENRQEHAFQHGGTFIFKDKHGQQRLARQLPNSYLCPFRVIDQSKKRLNSKLQDLVKKGKRGNVQFERRYFADGRSLADSNSSSGFVRDQQIAGRNIWTFFGA